MEQMHNMDQFGNSQLDHEKFSFINQPGRGITQLHKKETMLKKKTPFNEFVQQFNVYKDIVHNEELKGVKREGGFDIPSMQTTKQSDMFPNIEVKAQESRAYTGQ